MKDEREKKAAPGGDLEVQLCPFGNWRNRGVTQVCDARAFARIIEKTDLSRQILVDFEHDSESADRPTTAAAWIDRLWVDPERGLMANMKLTEAGAKAVSTRELRFLSPCWELGDDGRPEKLVSVGLTNKPAIPVSPMVNRAESSNGGEAADASGGEPPAKKENAMEMKAILEALGLPPEATSEQAVAAVEGLKKQLSELQAMQDDCAAEKFAEDNKKKCGNKAALKAAWLKNREVAEALVASLPDIPEAAPAAAPQVVLNKSEAKTPQLSGGKLCKADARAKLSELPPSEREKFYAAHREEID